MVERILATADSGRLLGSDESFSVGNSEPVVAPVGPIRSRPTASRPLLGPDACDHALTTEHLPHHARIAPRTHCGGNGRPATEPVGGKVAPSDPASGLTLTHLPRCADDDSQLNIASLGYLTRLAN
jgi:hypothetical protein